jgi:hypothetical protein
MSKVYVQAPGVVLETTSSLAAGATVSGSAYCAGYAYLVGGLISNASSTASGVHIQQSMDYGAHWDQDNVYAIAACVSASYSVPIYGNAIKVTASNGLTAASFVRGYFWLRPI